MHPRDARRQLGLSVYQFAAALGVAPQTVRRWELSDKRASHREPGAATVRLIDMLLAGTPPRYPCGDFKTLGDE